MLQAYDTMVSAAEKGRISRLEMLDEVEEWSLLMAHYSLSVSVKGDLLAEVVDLIPVTL